jgi:hypothetical protein
MANSRPDPKEALQILDSLVKKGLITDMEFRERHHLHGSIKAFRRYCSTVNSFIPDGRNSEILAFLRSKSRP